MHAIAAQTYIFLLQNETLSCYIKFTIQLTLDLLFISH